MIEHSDQHIEAIKKSTAVKDEITCEIFDDKIKPMGTVAVSNGKITIDIHSAPSLYNDGETKKFLIETISLAIDHCYTNKPMAFAKTNA